MRVSHATSHSRGGFTLLELMLSITILLMLVGMFATFTHQANQAWSSSTANADRRRNIRAIADFIGSELKGAMLPVEQFVARPTGDLQFVVNPSNLPDQYRHADAIFWQAPLANETSFGEVAEVGYFVQWDDTNTQDPRPNLCRFFVNPSIQQTDGTVVRNPDFLIFDTNPTAWLQPALLQRLAPATKASGYAGLFGENVLGLWVQSYGLNGEGLGKSFDSRKGYDCRFTSNAGGTARTWTEKRYLPAKVNISIAQLDAATAVRLRPRADVLREISTRSDIRNAQAFLDEVRLQSRQDPLVGTLLKGLRIYSTDIQLYNAR